jgi:hypothetical protein
MPDNVAFPFFLLIALVVVGGFALGTGWNVRKGNDALKWLREGLPIVGERTTLRWLGSSVVELKMAKAKSPYRDVETLVVFEPRDVIFLWAWSRMQGRRDLLIFRGHLIDAPKYEVEIFDPQGWTTHHTERDVLKKKWTRADLTDSPSLLAYYSGSAGADVAKTLTDIATRAGGKLVRLSVHRDMPNIEAHWLLPDPGAYKARDLYTGLQHIGQQVTRA